MSGRPASERIIPGRNAISVGDPRIPLKDKWTWTPLSRLAELGTGHTPSRSVSEYWDGNIPWIGLRDANRHHGGVIEDTEQHVTEAGLANSAARLLPKDTVCLSRTASVGYVVKMSRPMATSQDFVTWTCCEALEPDYLMRALLAEGDDIRRFGNGSTHTTIYFPEVKAFHVALPPLAEQRRIVAKLDALDASAKRARADLDRIPTLVARAKQAILAEVFRLASKSSKELVAIEELVRQDAPICYGVVQPGDDKERGVPLVRVCDLDQGRIDWTAIRTVTAEIAAQYERSRIKDGDVLVSVVGTIGRVAVAREVPANCNIARAVARIRPKSERASSEWLSIALQAPQVQERFMADSREVARKTLNISLLKEVKIPDISSEFQVEIVRRIEAAFAKIDRVADEAGSARALLDRLDQAILAKAFRGELVPQDPNDEPAEKLLEKIKAARAAPPARKIRKKQS